MRGPTRTTPTSSARGGGPALRDLSGVRGRGAGSPTGPQPSTTSSRMSTIPRAVTKPTERSEFIKREMEKCDDEYFGRAPTVPGARESAPAAVQSAVAPSGANATFSRPSSHHVTLPPSWRQGPRDPSGKMFNASDRNLMCLDILPEKNLAVMGSADHGLMIWDYGKNRKVRNLYSKTAGHTEWVTSCCYLPDGRVLSGGMDSKLCLWHSSAVRCNELAGHTGSISQVTVNPAGTAISASYDRTLKIWDCNGSGSLMGTLKGHDQPVMQFEWNQNTLFSGDRKGKVVLWSPERQQAVTKVDTQGGQIGALTSLVTNTETLALAGDQKGCLSVWDFRAGNTDPAVVSKLHPGGVISGLKTLANGHVVSAGADNRLLCLDPRQNFGVVHEMKDHKDFIYSLETHENLILSGGGNGWILAHDAATGKCLYGLGAGENAIRGIKASQNVLVAAGDDGKAIAYDF